MAKINKDQVLQRVNQSLNKHLFGKSKSNVYGSENINLEFVESYGDQEKDTIYVLKNNDQLLFSPADDECKPIIGYIDNFTDKFKFNDLPLHVKEFLRSYATDVEIFQNSVPFSETDNLYNKNNTEQEDGTMTYGATTYNNIVPTIDEIKSEWHDITTTLNGANFLWQQGIPYYEESSYKFSTGKTHENYADNKFLWQKDVQNSFVDSKRGTYKATVKYAEKKSPGTSGYSFTYASPFTTDLNRFIVKVGSTTWTLVSEFGTTTSKNEYKLSQNASNVVTVKFGDGVTSNIPKKDTTIYLQYKANYEEYFYPPSVTPDKYIKSYAGCSTIALSTVIAYWGKYGVKTYKNGLSQTKTYRVGSKAMAKKTQLPSAKDKINNGYRWFIFEFPKMNAISTFDYDNLAASSYIKWYNGNTQLFKVAQDTSIDIVSENGYMTAEKRDIRTAIGTLVKYVNRAINSENAPSGSGAYLTNGFGTLRNYIPFGKNAYFKSATTATMYSLANYFTATGDASPFLYGASMDTYINNKTNTHDGIDAFEVALYRELEKNIPVPFAVWGQYVGSGTARDSAHSIVCCGYKKETTYGLDLWRFNFGWNTSYFNSWFTLRPTNVSQYQNQLAPGDYRYNRHRQILYRFYPNEYYNDFIEVTKNKITFENSGGTDTVLVCSMEYNTATQEGVKTSLNTWNYNTANIPSWLTIERDTETGVKLYFKANANTGTTKTHSLRVFKTKDNSVYTDVIVTLKGSGQEIVYTLEVGLDYDTQNNYYILAVNHTGYNTEDYIITVSSNTDWEIVSYDSTSWLKKCQKLTSGLAIRVAENTTHNSRTSTIVLRTTDSAHSVQKTIKIQQAAAPVYYLNLETEYLPIDKAGGTYYVEVLSNLEWSITYNKPSWLTVTKDQNLNRIMLVSTQNTQATAFTCDITIKPADTTITDTSLIKTLTVSLESNIYLTLSKLSLIFNNHENSESKNITLTCNTTWSFTNITGSWVSITQTTQSNNTFNLVITAQPNLQNNDKTITIKFYTNDESAEEYLVITALGKPEEQQDENILKLSTNKIIFNQTYKQGIVQVFSNNVWYIDNYENLYSSSNLYGAGNNNWLNIQTEQTDDPLRSNLIINTNYNGTGTESFTLNLLSNTGLQQNLQIEAQGITPSDSGQDDEIGQDDGNGNIIINKNGQNINISLYGINGVNTIKDKSVLTLYYDSGSGYQDKTSELDDYNLTWNLNIPANTELTSKIYKLYGTYKYINNTTVNSRILSFIQKAQEFTIHINVNKDLFNYIDVDTLTVTYWVETSNGLHIYDSAEVQLTTINPDSGNPMNFQTIQGPTTDTTNGVLIKTFNNLSNNTDNIERRLILKVTYKTLTQTLIIKQLSELQIMLRSFDFFTIEYNKINDYNDYISVRNFTNMNQLSSVNTYAGEEIHTIMVLSANDNLPINKTINNIVVDLSNIKIGYQQDVAQNNSQYSNFFRYSGKNINGLETESILINLFNIIQDLYEGIDEITCTFYAHWANTRSTGKLNTKITTYKNQPNNINLNNYVYTCDNTTVEIKTNTNYVYDISNNTSNILNYTKILQLVYNVKTKTGIIFNINEPHNAATNIYVFSPGYNMPLVTNYIDNTYETNITVRPSTSSSNVITKIYFHNMIYQNFDMITSQLSLYQAVTDNVSIESSPNITTQISTDSIGKYLQIQSPQTLGTYNIVLSLSPSNKLITLKVIVENSTELTGDMLPDPDIG